jgi:ectoine hydroxylase-related dioxygenase (phytanoyl-CoA dioxygenase family)
MQNNTLQHNNFSEEYGIEKSMFNYFAKDKAGFVNCGSACQNLISLHRLALKEQLIETLQSLGMGTPNICTRPVIYFNSVQLAEHEIYYKTPPHQDWRSMQGSLNAIVVWVPLVDVTIPLGTLEVIPGSHLDGLFDSVEDPFYRKIMDIPNEKFIPVCLKKGDALFFSSFLVHRSGNNITDRIRWSCHYRYNDLDEPTFIQRKFPTPYSYKPSKTLLTPDFPSKEEVVSIYNS